MNIYEETSSAPRQLGDAFTATLATARSWALLESRIHHFGKIIYGPWKSGDFYTPNVSGFAIIGNYQIDTVNERRITERRITERRIIERRITERRITERRKLPNAELLNAERYWTQKINERRIHINMTLRMDMDRDTDMDMDFVHVHVRATVHVHL